MNTDSVFLTGVIDYHDPRAVAILDIDNDFLHAENDKYVLMLRHGKLAKLLVKIYHKLYKKYVITWNHGVPILYVKLTRALY